LPRLGAPRGRLRGQDPQGREARRSPDRATHEVRVGDQPEDSEGPRADDPAVVAAAGGSSDRIAPCSTNAASSSRRHSSARLPPAIPTEVPMRLIGLAVVLVLSLTFASLAADVQQVGKVWRVGMLNAASRDSAPAYRFLPKMLRELGYVEGQNLMFEWRFADGDVGRLPELASDLVRSDVDIIVTGSMSQLTAARQP